MDRVDLKKIMEEMMGLEEITVLQDIDIVDDHGEEWIGDQSKPEVEFDDEQQQSYDCCCLCLGICVSWNDGMK